jgi:hypothetical protein
MRTLRGSGITAPSVLFLLVACSGGTPEASPTTPRPSPQSTSRAITLPLDPIPPFTVRGTVKIDAAGNSYQMIVTVQGLVVNSRHLLNMHGGTCARPILVQQEVITLGEAQADASGTATYTSPTFPYPYRVPAGGRILTVHNEPLRYQAGETPVPMGHIACADLTN